MLAAKTRTRTTTARPSGSLPAPLLTSQIRGQSQEHLSAGAAMQRAHLPITTSSLAEHSCQHV